MSSFRLITQAGRRKSRTKLTDFATSTVSNNVRFYVVSALEYKQTRHRLITRLAPSVAVLTLLLSSHRSFVEGTNHLIYIHEAIDFPCHGKSASFSLESSLINDIPYPKALCPPHFLQFKIFR